MCGQVTASTSVLMILFTSSAIALSFYFQVRDTLISSHSLYVCPLATSGVIGLFMCCLVSGRPASVQVLRHTTSLQRCLSLLCFVRRVYSTLAMPWCWRPSALCHLLLVGPLILQSSGTSTNACPAPSLPHRESSAPYNAWTCRCTAGGAPDQANRPGQHHSAAAFGAHHPRVRFLPPASEAYSCLHLRPVLESWALP